MHKNHHFIPSLTNPPPNPGPAIIETIHKTPRHNIPPLERIGNMEGWRKGDGQDDVCWGGGTGLGSYF